MANHRKYTTNDGITISTDLRVWVDGKEVTPKNKKGTLSITKDGVRHRTSLVVLLGKAMRDNDKFNKRVTLRHPFTNYEVDDQGIIWNKDKPNTKLAHIRRNRSFSIRGIDGSREWVNGIREWCIEGLGMMEGLPIIKTTISMRSTYDDISERIRDYHKKLRFTVRNIQMVHEDVPDEAQIMSNFPGWSIVDNGDEPIVYNNETGESQNLQHSDCEDEGYFVMTHVGKKMNIIYGYIDVFESELYSSSFNIFMK